MPRKVDANVELSMRRRRTCSLSSGQCSLSQVANLLRVQLLLLPLVNCTRRKWLHWCSKYSVVYREGEGT